MQIIIVSINSRQKYEKELTQLKKEVIEPLQKAGGMNKVQNTAANTSGSKKTDGDDVENLMC